MSLQKRLFAWFFHTFLGGHADLNDPFTRDIRAPLLAQAQGKVLEIGAGDGGNLPFYPPDVDLTLLDINPYMLNYLKTAAAELDVQPYRLVVGQGEELPFPDDSFDTSLTVHVLWCVIRPRCWVRSGVFCALVGGFCLLNMLQQNRTHRFTAASR
jgi:SAM-dependent methyltransferase